MASRWIVCCGILAVGILSSGAVFAQQVAVDSEGRLEEVLVTAQKREQDLQEIPSSVVALSDEKLDVMTSGGMDIRLLSSRVPSLYVESSYGRTLPRFYIRGLGNTDFDLNASQPVSLVYDEVVLENPILKGFPIFDLERVEVLRGPQGTLFGRNTPAGIVKFDSVKPAHKTSGFGRVSYGRFNTVQLEAAAGGPLAKDKLAGRASFLLQRRSNWVSNTFTGEENALEKYTDIAGRIQLLLTPVEQFDVLLNVHGRDLDGTARLFQANMIPSGTSDIDPSFDREKAAIDGANQQEVQVIGGVLRMDYDFGRTVLTSVTGYENGEIFSRGDVDGGFGAVFAPPTGPRGDIPFPSETADGIPNLDQFTQEVRFASADWDRTNFQAGFFYFQENLSIESYSYDTLTSGRPQNGFAAQNQKAQAWALFGTVDFAATDRLNLLGGVRYSDDEKDFVAWRTESPVGGGSLPAMTVNPTADFVSWDVSGIYQATPTVNVYGRVARSFRAPSIQGRVLFGDTITVADTEKILSFEVGTKKNLAGNRLRSNFSLFYYRMDDQQLTAVGGEENFNRILNAKNSNGYGLELDLEWLQSSQLFITAGVSYNFTEIDDPNLGVVPGAAAGLTVLDPALGTSGAVSIDKNVLPNAPRWVLNGTLRGSVPVGSSGEVFLYTDWAYRSQVNFFLYDSVEFKEKSLVEGGLRIGYTPFDRRYEVAVFGRNISNDLSRTGGIDFNNLTGFVNDPWTLGLEVIGRL